MTDETPPSTLLICFDGSDRAAHAVAVAARLFPAAHAHVLNVWEPLEHIVARYAALGPFVGDGVGEADTGLEDEAKRIAEAGVMLARQDGLDATAHTSALRISVFETVIDVADAFDVDVVITGTRSLHGLREVLSNTLSHALLQRCHRPVLAIPAPVAAN